MLHGQFRAPFTSDVNSHVKVLIPVRVQRALHHRGGVNLLAVDRDNSERVGQAEDVPLDERVRSDNCWRREPRPCRCARRRSQHEFGAMKQHRSRPKSGAQHSDEQFISDRASDHEGGDIDCEQVVSRGGARGLRERCKAARASGFVGRGEVQRKAPVSSGSRNEQPLGRTSNADFARPDR